MTEAQRDRARSIRHIYDLRSTIPYDPDSDSAYITDDVEILSQFAPALSSRILDVGCGLGWHLERLYKLGYTNLHGIDVSRSSLDAFQARIGSPARESITLICDDLRSYRSEIPFDVVCSFLCCIGSFGDQGDILFASAIRALLKADACFVMTSFYREGVSDLVGEFKTAYAKNSEVILNTTSKFESLTNEMVFNQKITKTGDLNETIAVPEERIRLYTVEELKAVFRRAGFSEVSCMPECKLDERNRPVDRSAVLLTIARHWG
ncbi:MAG: class I SAM-dependent methyltransferase [Deltaproteobacteria bacterium]|nr:class I SAM-dependent methyltransferase [Deltaproteobacteria bacterium]